MCRTTVTLNPQLHTHTTRTHTGRNPNSARAREERHYTRLANAQAHATRNFAQHPALGLPGRQCGIRMATSIGYYVRKVTYQRGSTSSWTCFSQPQQQVRARHRSEWCCLRVRTTRVRKCCCFDFTPRGARRTKLSARTRNDRHARNYGHTAANGTTWTQINVTDAESRQRAQAAKSNDTRASARARIHAHTTRIGGASCTPGRRSSTPGKRTCEVQRHHC